MTAATPRSTATPAAAPRRPSPPAPRSRRRRRRARPRPPRRRRRDAAPLAAGQPRRPRPPPSTPAPVTPSTPATARRARRRRPSTRRTTRARGAGDPAGHLGADAASLYDPYTRATAGGDPADSLRRRHDDRVEGRPRQPARTCRSASSSTWASCARSRARARHRDAGLPVETYARRRRPAAARHPDDALGRARHSRAVDVEPRRGSAAMAPPSRAGDSDTPQRRR